IRPAILDCNGAPLAPAKLAQPLYERGDPMPQGRSRAGTEEPDGRQLRRLLRARRERPRGCRAADQRDELAPRHSITSSTRPIIGRGTVRPSALAVFMLMTSSTLVACWTGSSAGFSPLRIRPV